MFYYKGTDSFSIQSTAPVEAIVSNLSALQSMQQNQAAYVIATLSMRDGELKSTLIKTTSKTLQEDCNIEDTTRTAEMHFWGPIFKELKDGPTRSKIWLSNISKEPVIWEKGKLFGVNGHKLVDNPDKELRVEKFLLIKIFVFPFPAKIAAKR